MQARFVPHSSLRGQRYAVGCPRRVFMALVVLTAAIALAQGQEINTGGMGRSEALSCSPAPCVLPPTQATQGGFDAPVAANPAKQQDLIVGSDDLQCPYPTNSGFNLSFDGGSSWNDLFCMQPLVNNGNVYGAGGSPILGYDLTGTVYVGGSYFNEDGESAFEFEVFQKSSDGENWSSPAPVVVRPNYDPFYCWMAVDANASSPYVNAVYVSCVLSGPLGNGSKNQVVVSHSNNGGATWHQVNVAPTQVVPDVDAYTATTVGKDGTVYLTWLYCNTGPSFWGNNIGYILFSKSGDGGNTWTVPSLAATVTLHATPHVEVGVPDGPAIAVDNSSGAYAGNLYISMYNWTGTSMQVQVIRSTNGGSTWSKPVPVSPGITHDQFLPWISVSSQGEVGVSWLDRRNDPKDIDYQAYAGLSSDGGLTFENVQLTTAFSNPNKPKGQDIGNYTGNTWDGPNYFIAAWMDNSQSSENEDFVGGIRLK